MTAVTEQTRSMLTAVFATWQSAQDPQPFVAALADDLVWTVTGTSPLSGTYRSKQEYLTNVLHPLTQRLQVLPTLVLKRLLVDGEWAAAHLEGYAAGRRAENYDMEYAWLIQVGDHKIRQVIGFYDSAKVNALFAP